MVLEKQLNYPFHKSWSPELGKPFEVSEGVFWLRMPLPFALNHINLWLLKDVDEQWTIVDTGIDCDLCRDTWRQVFAEFVSPNDIKRIIVTHYHPDHIGLASWLAQECDCKVWITRQEHALYWRVNHRDPNDFAEQVASFMHQHGHDETYTASYLEMTSSSKKESYLHEDQCHFIEQDDAIVINDIVWQVVIGNGHSPEHACLYSPTHKLLIAGDQALPRISSNVSVYIDSDITNPLDNWLNSCRKLQQVIDNKTMVLPAHQEPFFNIHLRMQQLLDEHADDLIRLKGILQQPLVLQKACAQFFARELNDIGRMMAMGETLSHINYLLYAGEVEKIVSDDGVFSYQTI